MTEIEALSEQVRQEAVEAQDERAVLDYDEQALEEFTLLDYEHFDQSLDEQMIEAAGIAIEMVEFVEQNDAITDTHKHAIVHALMQILVNKTSPPF